MANNFLPLQAQNFSISGSGAVVGDTTLILKIFQTIDGTPITMSMLGLIAFMTLEPGNGILEEQISFTGVTQNSNGTASLTGVSNVSFAYPYTKTSGLLKTHAGSTTAILSNTSGFYNQFVAKDDDGTISEVLTFTQPNFPQMDGTTTPPSLPAQLVTKAYADSLAIAGAPNASTSTKGIVQIATQAQVDAKTLIGSTSAVLVQPLNTQRSTLLSDYVLDTSASPNIIIISPSPAISSYVAGQTFSFKLANTNTSPVVTLNVNSVGSQNIIIGSSSPVIGEMVSGNIIVVEYDGTNFQTISSPAGTISSIGTAAQGDTLYYNGSAWVRLGAGTAGQVLNTNGTSANPLWANPISTTTGTNTGPTSGGTINVTNTITHGLGKTPTLINLSASFTLTSNSGSTFSVQYFGTVSFNSSGVGLSGLTIGEGPTNLIVALNLLSLSGSNSGTTQSQSMAISVTAVGSTTFGITYTGSANNGSSITVGTVRWSVIG
jgi:hypothetical protein